MAILRRVSLGQNPDLTIEATLIVFGFNVFRPLNSVEN